MGVDCAATNNQLIRTVSTELMSLATTNISQQNPGNNNTWVENVQLGKSFQPQLSPARIPVKVKIVTNYFLPPLV